MCKIYPIDAYAQATNHRCRPRYGVGVAHSFHGSDVVGLIKQGIEKILFVKSELCADNSMGYGSVDNLGMSSLRKLTAELLKKKTKHENDTYTSSNYLLST